ncbi:Protein GLB-33 [Aphelenchoides avenae]|nr:Protein GLB-33 [Aphelenchus avenae]
MLAGNYTTCPRLQQWSESYRLFSQILNGILTTACVLVGTVGNLHSVKSVHFANFDKNQGIVLAVSIVALAFWDTILLWCAFFYYGLKNIDPTAQNSDLVNLITPWFHAFSQIANTASIWCVVSITVQRYMATRDPFRTTRWLLHITSTEIKEHHRILLNSFRGVRRKSSLSKLYTMYRRHFRLPIVISALAILVNIPAFFEIYTALCYRPSENKLVYGLRISELRLNRYYKLWYKVVFRMLVTSCGPNIFILFLTVVTVMLLRGSNRSRKQLFQMSESLIERYSSKATMLTMISIMLVIKFLLFRSLSFVLDIWEVTFGFGSRINIVIYIVDISNFLILLNSASNSVIIFRGSKWIQQKIVQRNTLKREKQMCVDSIQSGQRVHLLQKSWSQTLYLTNRQFGNRVLYAMLLRNPQMFASFREMPRSISTSSALSNASSVYSNNAASTAVTVVAGATSNGLQVKAAEAAASIPHLTKRSVDLLMNSKFHEIGERITAFIGELIEMMRTENNENAITARMRRVGAIHYEHSVSFPSSAWKEFKTSALGMIAECNFASETERAQTLEAWSSFLSVIIREMKMGMWGQGGGGHKCSSVTAPNISIA